MSEQSWDLKVDGREHRIDVVHGYWSARRQVAVDGHQVMLIRPANVLQQLLWWALPTDHGFPIASHQGLLRVTPDLARNSYRLSVALDGKWVDSGAAVEPIPGPYGIALRPDNTRPPSEALLGTGFFLVGGAAILALASSTWESLPPGRPYVIGALVALAYATMGGSLLALSGATLFGTRPLRSTVISGLIAGSGVVAALMYSTPVVANPIRSVVGDSVAAAIVALGIWIVIVTGLWSYLAAVGVAWSLIRARRRAVLWRLARVLVPALGVLAITVVARGPSDWRPATQAEPFAVAVILSIATGTAGYLARRLSTETRST